MNFRGYMKKFGLDLSKEKATELPQEEAKISTDIIIETDKATFDTSKLVKEVDLKSLTQTALGVFKNHKIGEWHVAVVKFDPVTGQAQVTERLAGMDNSRDGAIERFKIEAANREVIG